MTGNGTRGSDLAKQLLAWEAGESRDPVAVAAAATTVCQALYLEIGQFIGPDGFTVLLARALGLARADFPLLETVVVGEVSDGNCLNGLVESIPQRDATEVTEAITAVLGGFVDLLITFIGDDLALRMINRRWPGVPPTRRAAGAKGRSNG